MIHKSALTEIVYERITQMLYDGIYKPGSPLTRKELSERLNVSPTPVGEAIARLVGEGIVEQVGRSGYRVKEFTYENLESLYAVRAGIEGIAIRLCIENAELGELEEICHCFDEFLTLPVREIERNAYMKADQKFHRRIVEYCRNPYILSYNHSYEFLLRSYQRGLMRPPEDTINEHQEIVAAIRAMDAQKAQIRMTEHHMATTRVIRKQFINI